MTEGDQQGGQKQRGELQGKGGRIRNEEETDIRKGQKGRERGGKGKKTITKNRMRNGKEDGLEK